MTAETVVHCTLLTIRYALLTSQPPTAPAILSDPQGEFHSLLHSQRRVKEIVLEEKQALPPYLRHLEALLQTELPDYNHLLINVYPPGIGIMPHFDGPLYRSKVVVLSLGGPALIAFATDYSNTQHSGRLLL